MADMIEEMQSQSKKTDESRQLIEDELARRKGILGLYQDLLGVSIEPLDNQVETFKVMQ